MKEKSCEFGRGLIYPLALFCCHAESKLLIQEEANGFFNSASDHLYELVIPKSMIIRLHGKKSNKALGVRILNFRKECINLGHGEGLRHRIDKKEAERMIQECKDIMFELDKFYGNKPIKGVWE